MSSRSSSHSSGVQSAKKRFEDALKGKKWAESKKKKQVKKPAAPKPKVPNAGEKKAVGVKKKRKVAAAEEEEEEEDDDDGVAEVNEDADQQEQLHLETVHQKVKVVSDMAGGWDPTIQDALFDLLQEEGVVAPGGGIVAATTDSPAQRLLKQQEREALREASETVNTILAGYVNCLMPAFGMSYLIEKN